MEIELLLSGACLTTLQILYRLPDHPKFLQTFLWQLYDIPPEFPKVLQFLEFWARSIDGRVYSVELAVAGHLVKPSARMTQFYGTLQ